MQTPYGLEALFSSSRPLPTTPTPVPVLCNTAGHIHKIQVTFERYGSAASHKHIIVPRRCHIAIPIGIYNI